MLFELFPLSESYNITISSGKKYSTGFDVVPCYILKNVADEIVPTITYLVNLSFEEGTFPKQL